MSIYVYIKSEQACRDNDYHDLWTVGFYKPDGKFEPESDHGTQETAALRTAWLNGASDIAPELAALRSRVREYEEQLSEIVTPDNADKLEWQDDGVPIMRGSPNLPAFVAFLHNKVAEAHAELVALRAMRDRLNDDALAKKAAAEAYAHGGLPMFAVNTYRAAVRGEPMS